jgi:hypothetical protein
VSYVEDSKTKSLPTWQALGDLAVPFKFRRV